jgi:hypothetical protein
VKNRLALFSAGIELQPKLTVREHRRHLADKRKQTFKFCGVVELGDVTGVIPGNDKDVHFGQRVDVPKGDCHFILGNYFRSELAGDNLAKQTVHQTSDFILRNLTRNP